MICNRPVLARRGEFLEHYERGASLREVRPTLDVVSLIQTDWLARAPLRAFTWPL